MKKILISLSIIGAIGAIATGATIALFNDTETSTGNILVAGTMDLKVDHKYAMYDGNECVTNCEPGTTNLVSNGSFETPIVTNPAKWDIFPSVVGGWTVLWEGGQTTYQDRIRPETANLELQVSGVLSGSAYEGNQYAELDTDWFGPNDPLNGEPAAARIYQDVPTTPGKQYQLNFVWSPRPGEAASENILEVKWNGVVIDTLGPTAVGGSISWTPKTYQLSASNGATTRLEFADKGTPNDSLGPFLDDVRVYEMNCDYQITGGTCTLWDLKDLGRGDYYWHYDDVKPGDYGVNIISLHAYNNDAYACLITHNIVDEENTRLQSEIIDNDITPGPGPGSGELSPFIEVFAWEDVNQNNVYDLGDNPISGPGSSLATAIGKIPLTASHTKYIGLAWCAGTQSFNTDGYTIKCDGSSMGNIAQSDIMTASITAYAEQQRNNENFVCPNWNQSIKQ